MTRSISIFGLKTDVRIVAGALLLAALLSLGLYRVLYAPGPEKPPGNGPGTGEVPTDPHDPPADPTPDPEPYVPPDPELAGAFIVSIDNKVEARPHTGLEHADLIIEVLAEWRITRLLAFYHTYAAEVIGPVRSARYYGAQLVAPYNSPFAHAGGSADSLELIRKLGVPDLDEINNASAAFWRDNSDPNRRAPHNLYTSTDKMADMALRRNLTVTPMPELSYGPAREGLPAAQIGIVYSVRNPAQFLIDYRVDWVWENDAYYRYMNSLPHVTTGGQHLSAGNVIVILVNHRDLVSAASWRTEMDLIGTGEAVFFRDGQAHIGTWTKKDAKSHFEYQVDGEPYLYAPGATWIQIVPNTALFEF